MAKLERAALTPHTATLVARLEDAGQGVRWVAVQALLRLEPTELAKHAEAVRKRLADDEAHGCETQLMARVLLHKVEPAVGHIEAVVARLEDAADAVRVAAVYALSELEPAALATHAAAVAARLEDADETVRLVAVHALARLGPADLAKHAAAIRKLVERDEDEELRRAAHGVVVRLERGDDGG